jgi:hypothetical protein
MFRLTRVPALAVAGALVALTAASARAEDHKSIPATAAQAELHTPLIGDCHLQRRAISRRACLASLWREINIDTAENK